MLTTMLVTLREESEAFLIVAITLACPQWSGRGALAPAVCRATAGGVAGTPMRTA
jgi:high-affinity Fe2+/Pb2+ permease